MNVLICPDKFKGSLTAEQAAEAIRRGVLRALPEAEIVVQPLADGGEGSLELLGEVLGLAYRPCTVVGPLRKTVDAGYLLGRGKAVIESSHASGLQLVPPARRHPKNTTTIGVGSLIDDALVRGATDITILLGGSATNDAGAGMAAALGYRFLGPSGEDFVPMADSLKWVKHIDADGRHKLLDQARFTAVYDVNSRLLGPNGATHTYARQKGARPDDLDELETNMRHFASLLEALAGQPIQHMAGSGAAGGLGAGAVAFLGATLRSGTEVIFDVVGLDAMARRADLIITGEGKVDRQTLAGKVVAGVISKARPTVVVCGRSEVTAAQLGAQRILSIIDQEDVTEHKAIIEAASLLETMVGDYLSDRYRN